MLLLHRLPCQCLRDPTWMRSWHRNQRLAPSPSVLFVATSPGQTVMLPDFLDSSSPHRTLATLLINSAPHFRRPPTRRGPYSHGYITMLITTLTASLLEILRLQRPKEL